MRNKQLIENIGLSAVVISLLFVAYEIRQSNQIAIVNTEFELRSSYSAINEEVFSNPEMAEFFDRIKDPGVTLIGPERERARSLAAQNMNIWVATDLAYISGMTTEVTYENILNDIKESIASSSPSMVSVWKDVADDYPALANTSVFIYLYEQIDQYQ